MASNTDSSSSDTQILIFQDKGKYHLFNEQLLMQIPSIPGIYPSMNVDIHLTVSSNHFCRHHFTYPIQFISTK